MCQSLAWIIDLFLAQCACACVCVRHKSWAVTSPQPACWGCITVTYCDLSLSVSELLAHSSLCLPPSLALSSLTRLRQSVCVFWPDVSVSSPAETHLPLLPSLSSSGCCAGTERWGSGKTPFFSLSIISAHLTLFSHFAEKLL